MEPQSSAAEYGRRPFGLTLTWLAAAGMCAAVFAGEVSAAPPAFKPKVVVRRTFRPITKPPVATASEAARQIEETELVLGVEMDGQSRAYPINMLTGPSREIINDTLAGHAIAATW